MAYSSVLKRKLLGVAAVATTAGLAYGAFVTGYVFLTRSKGGRYLLDSLLGDIDQYAIVREKSTPHFPLEYRFFAVDDSRDLSIDEQILEFVQHAKERPSTLAKEYTRMSGAEKWEVETAFFAAGFEEAYSGDARG